MNPWNISDPVTFKNFNNLKIVVTGGGGFVGRHIIQLLIDRGADPKKILIPKSSERDMRISKDAEDVVAGQDLVIHLAARVGGIGLNQRKPADLIYDNGMMGLNVIHAAHKARVKKIVVAG